MGAIKAPDNMKKVPPNQSKVPQVKVDLDWVYGIRGSKCRNGLSYLEDGRLCYFNAGVGIVYDPKEKRRSISLSTLMTLIALLSIQMAVPLLLARQVRHL